MFLINDSTPTSICFIILLSFISIFFGTVGNTHGWDFKFLNSHVISSLFFEERPHTYNRVLSSVTIIITIINMLKISNKRLHTCCHSLYKSWQYLLILCWECVNIISIMKIFSLKRASRDCVVGGGLFLVGGFVKGLASPIFLSHLVDLYYIVGHYKTVGLSS